jgi:predicted GNAT family acetyltransferase
MFNVKNMEIGDFPFAVQLANTMNWNMTAGDFEFMMKLEPQGCFVLFHSQERLGIATSITFGNVGWFGNFIIKEDFRREGAGSLLMKHAIDFLKRQGVETIGLYAYPHLVRFYQSVGFETDIDFLVLQGKAVFPAPQELAGSVKKADVPKVIGFDCRCFGASRKKLLEPILLNANNLCFTLTENNEIIGYIAAKVYDDIAEVGPLICLANRVEASVLLLKTILSRLKGINIFMTIPKKEIALLDILFKAGLKEDFRVTRMFLGPAAAKNCIYAAESLERG